MVGKVRDVNMKDVLSYELASTPPSLFDKSGEMRITKAKATLKAKLQVEQSVRFSTAPDGIVVLYCG